ncbi:glycoside hydrolase family 2 protein [Solitalea sp. MAHUQ-68]|uniref:Beta-mannosidase B n=1 Tax=Solitalea agri TaxID=2953739 RepID=A0A9X2F2C5_9SPHI|nr:glycoside hydrolase family 2 protein [Solitalea agri]MCO4292905.1 glycoside hydrolase family 2 protein [Solitalea agri]
MKIFNKTYLTIIAMLTTSTAWAQSVKVIELNQGWKFKQPDAAQWLPATVPGTVHTDLLANKVINDPFYRTNEKDVQWVETKDWVYETVINIDEELNSYSNIDLQFDGLDTYADVFVNDSLVLKTNNMFIGYQAHVKNFLKLGENKLKVYFHSPVNTALPQANASSIKYPADNDASPVKTSVFSRKAPYHFGWDWGPRLVTSGLWKPVKLVAWNKVKIIDTFVQQLYLGNKQASLEATLEVESAIDKTVQLKVSSPDNEFETVYMNQYLTPGRQNVSVTFKIENPKRWWPNGLGDQKLYKVALEVITEDGGDKKEQKIGLRTLQVVNEPDPIGESFYVKVNGATVFMKGANYIPSDSFLPRVTTDKLQKVFADVKQSNMNMLRIWGGGVYESDEFYNLADENGILIWQDFMFACTMYPSDSTFLTNVKAEAEYNVKRLRKHPSLALWCGNNEIGVAWKNWGWQSTYKYTQKDQQELEEGYKKVFNEILPQTVEHYDANRFYFPSSPISNWGKADDFKKGDNHFWGVWHAELPFEDYNTHVPRFMSEYGFQSFPDIITVKRFAKPEDFDINSAVMKTHQKSYKGNGLIKVYMDRYYRTPKDFESFLYVGQILQAEGIKLAIEAHRRNMPYCMGTLYWQLNDCWPVASWSSIDYFGRWKALQYFAKDAFAPILVEPEIEKGNLNVYAVSDLRENKQGELKLKLIDFKGTVVWSKSEPVQIAANSSKVIYTESLNEHLNKVNKTEHLLSVELMVDGKLASKNTLYLDTLKSLNLTKPNIKHEITKSDKGFRVSLSTDVLAKNVYLLLPNDQHSAFSQNYFDLLPSETKAIDFTSDLTLEQVKSNLKIITLIDSYSVADADKPTNKTEEKEKPGFLERMKNKLKKN